MTNGSSWTIHAWIVALCQTLRETRAELPVNLSGKIQLFSSCLTWGGGGKCEQLSIGWGKGAVRKPSLQRQSWLLWH